MKSAKGITLKLDKVWSLLIKERDGFICVKCGNVNYLNSHHIYGRRKQSTRWDIDNGITLCATCHKFSTDFSAHETPQIFSEWLRELKGDEFMDALEQRANKHLKLKPYEKEELLIELKLKLQKL